MSKFTYLNEADKYIKHHLNMLVLTILKNKLTYGYDLIAKIHDEFKILLSPGSLHPLLYQLEKMEYIKANYVGRKKIYQITPAGLKRLESVNSRFSSITKEIEQYVNRVESKELHSKL